MYGATLPSERAAVRQAEAPLPRGDGATQIEFLSRAGRTGLGQLYQRAPLRVLFPRPAPGEPMTAALATISGGLAGGDRLAIDIIAGPGTRALATTQAAEKVYRSTGPDCVIDVNLSVARGAALEWMPQETILFEGARLDRRTEIDVAPGGRLLAGEAVILGRIAMGEAFTKGKLFESWRVRRGGKLIWADGLKLDGDIAALTNDQAGLGGAVALSSLIYLGDDSDRHLALARDILAAQPFRAAASLVNGVLVMRLMSGDAAALRRGIIALWGGLRAATHQAPGTVSRLWHI